MNRTSLPHRQLFWTASRKKTFFIGMMVPPAFIGFILFLHIVEKMFSLPGFLVVATTKLAVVVFVYPLLPLNVISDMVFQQLVPGSAEEALLAISLFIIAPFIGLIVPMLCGGFVAIVLHEAYLFVYRKIKLVK